MFAGQGVISHNQQKGIRATLHAFTIYGVLNALRINAASGLRSYLPRRAKGIIVAAFKTSMSRLRMAYIGMGLFALWRACEFLDEPTQ